MNLYIRENLCVFFSLVRFVRFVRQPFCCLLKFLKLKKLTNDAFWVRCAFSRQVLLVSVCLNALFFCRTFAVPKAKVRAEVRKSPQTFHPNGTEISPKRHRDFIMPNTDAVFPIIMTRNCPITPQRGNKLSAQGNALGFVRQATHALKGQKHCSLLGLLPFQGDGCVLSIPRALPWADSLLPFQGDGGVLSI